MLIKNHTHLFYSDTAKKLPHFGYSNTKVQEAYNIFCLVKNKAVFTILQRRPRIFKEFFFMLGRITKIFISSILQIRPRIFEESFLLGRMIKIFISSILQRRVSIYKEIFCLVE